MAKVGVKVHCILNWNSDYARMLVMQTLDNQISFPIIIAENEAISLLKELEKIKTQRPLTHDLLYASLQSFQIEVSEVYIHSLREGIFYTKIIYEKDDELAEIDARPSDAVILAVKSDAPIFVEEDILEKIGKKVEIEEQETETGLGEQSIEELEQKLQEAIEIEDFETASKIRDVIKMKNEG